MKRGVSVRTALFERGLVRPSSFESPLFSGAFARMANSFSRGRARKGSLPKASMEPPGGVELVLKMPVYPGVSLRYTEKAFVASLTCE